MPSLIILVITRIPISRSRSSWLKSFLQFSPISMASMTSESNHIHTTTCYDEYKILSCDHACKITICNSIRIWPSHVIFIHAINQTCNHHIQCSRCLPWACSGAGHINTLQENYLHSISYFQKYSKYHLKQNSNKKLSRKFWK